MNENTNKLPLAPITRLPHAPITRLPHAPVTRLPIKPQTSIGANSGHFFANLTKQKNTESNWKAKGFTKKIG